jgi:hypothetical protein
MLVENRLHIAFTSALVVVLRDAMVRKNAPITSGMQDTAT